MLVPQGLILQISIMLSLKNTSESQIDTGVKKMLLLYPCASLDQLLTENVMQIIYLWHDLKEFLAKKFSYETLFSNKTNICDILIFTMSQRWYFFNMSIYMSYYQATRMHSHFCITTPILSFVQCQVSFWLLPSLVTTFNLIEIF